MLGAGTVRIGDVLGAAAGRRPTCTPFAPPTLETVVEPAGRQQRGALHVALTQLAEQDPLIDLRRDETRGEMSRVALRRGAEGGRRRRRWPRSYGVEVTFRETTTLCVERLVGTGAAHELIAVGAEPVPGHRRAARSSRRRSGGGVDFRLGVERGSMPPAFFTAVEETVRGTLQQGLRGWPVLDCVVTMTHSGYWARQSHSHGTFDASMSSTAGDFRHLTPLVLMTALRQAGTRVLEPMHRFELEIPAGRARRRCCPRWPGCDAVPRATEPVGSSYLLERRRAGRLGAPAAAASCPR